MQASTKEAKAMRRLQLMELHEQAWCPAGIRNGATDCLNLLENVGQQYRYALDC
jgi:hypothetical protein